MGGKRKRKAKTNVLYKGQRGLEVLKLLCFYGFKYIRDIVTCASMCKALYLWSKGNVVVDCALKAVVKFGHNTPRVAITGWWLPTAALLACQKEFILFSLKFSETVLKTDVMYVDITAVIGNIYQVHVYYDHDTPAQWYCSTFSNPSAYMTAQLAWVTEYDDDVVHVTGINTYVKKH